MKEVLLIQAQSSGSGHTEGWGRAGGSGGGNQTWVESRRPEKEAGGGGGLGIMRGGALS